MIESLKFAIAKPVIGKNIKYKSIHKNETCLLFGNGSSLKLFDLVKLSSFFSIGCNSLFLHNDYALLKQNYYVLPTTFQFFPFRKYYETWTKNHIGLIYADRMKALSSVSFFTSLTNWVPWAPSNVHYMHHFGEKVADASHVDLHRRFSFMQGGLNAMVGLAIYMGFKEAILVGCDYTFSPARSLHFFEKGPGSNLDGFSDYSVDFFSECQSLISLFNMVPKGLKSNFLPSVTYEDITGEKEAYKENSLIISSDYLAKLGNHKHYFL
jgi:hypothetical protein